MVQNGFFGSQVKWFYNFKYLVNTLLCVWKSELNLKSFPKLLLYQTIQTYMILFFERTRFIRRGTELGLILCILGIITTCPLSSKDWWLYGIWRLIQISFEIWLYPVLGSVEWQWKWRSICIVMIAYITFMVKSHVNEFASTCKTIHKLSFYKFIRE